MAVCQWACDKNDGERTPDGKVTVALTAGTATGTSLTFRITASENAEELVYACYPAETEIPMSDDLFSTGTIVPAGDQQAGVDNLDPDTEYRIAAAARGRGQVSEVATIEMHTGTAPYRQVIATSSRGSSYYGNLISGETGTGQYHLNVGTIPFDKAGNAVGAGILYRLSLHAAPSENPDEAVLAPGTYRMDNTFAEGTFDLVYSSWVETDSQGNKVSQGLFDNGEITVGFSDGIYDVVCRMHIPAQNPVEVIWNGPIEWVNMIPGGQATFSKAYYFGKNKDHPESDKWIVQLADQYPETSWALQLECYTEVTPDYKHPVIASGTYTVGPADKTNAFTIVAGVMGPTHSLDYGTFLDSAYGTWYVSDGTVSIAREGEDYTFDCQIMDEKGNAATVHFTGKLPFENRYVPMTQTDLDVTFDRVCAAEYYGPLHTAGIHEYTFCLADGDIGKEWWAPKPLEEGEMNYLNLNLCSAADPDLRDIRIPEGTYQLNRELADYAIEQYSYLRHWDADHFKHDTYFESVSVTLAYTEAGISLLLEATDAEGKTIRGAYEGPCEIDNSSGVYPSRASVCTPAHPGLRLFTPAAADQTTSRLNVLSIPGR